MSNMSNNQNLAKNHSFKDLFWWAPSSENVNGFVYEVIPSATFNRYGETELHLKSNDVNTLHNGIYQEMPSTLPNSQYTFSAYVRVPREIIGGDGVVPGVYLRVISGGQCITESEHISTTLEEGEVSSDFAGKYVRLDVSFDSTDLNIAKLQILVDGKGDAYVEAVQLESGGSATAYNLMENGSFEYGLDGWAYGSSAADCTAPYLELGHCVKLSNATNSSKASVCRSVDIRPQANTFETFTLSGWAMAPSITKETMKNSPKPELRLRAVIYYADGSNETFKANFDVPFNGWQSGSLQFRKSKPAAVESMWVYLDYNYCAGDAYFDAISLVRDGIENVLPVESITFPHSTIYPYVGDTVALSATVLPDSDINKELLWTSSDESIATVDTEGVATWLKEGAVTITATAKDGSGASASCTVEVNPPWEEMAKTLIEYVKQFEPKDNKVTTEKDFENAIGKSVFDAFWCVDFVVECCLKSGVGHVVGDKMNILDTSSSTELKNWFKKNNEARLHEGSEGVQPGDIVFAGYIGDETMQHTCIATSGVNENGWVETINGNWGSPSAVRYVSFSESEPTRSDNFVFRYYAHPAYHL